jgi:aromatic ring-opening dioxygenase catalytic subunit (LigB family)
VATFAGAFAASHGPVIVRDWELLAPPLRDRFTHAFHEVGRRIAAAAPDVLVVVSPDHWENFFLDALPAIAIGVGDEYDGPPEPFMRAFPDRTIAGDQPFGAHLLATALENGFDPVASHRLTLDHGFCIPLWKSGLRPLPRIVPVVVNALHEPMPTIRRSLELGRLIRTAIASYPADVRIAVLGTGGLSHSIGETTMGDIDEDFDRAALATLHDAPGDEQLVTTITDALRHTGNGSHEVRCWVVAHGSAGSTRLDVIDYFPCPEVYVGCAFGSWQSNGANEVNAA